MQQDLTLNDASDAPPSPPTTTTLVSPLQDAASSSSSSSSSKGKELSVILMRILNDKVAPAAIWWLPCGKAFAVNPDTTPSKIMDVYFNGTKLSSFVRQLNNAGFQRTTRQHRKDLGGQLPGNAIIFSHELFQRNEPELFEQFRRSCGGKGKKLGRPRRGSKTSGGTTHKESEKTVVAKRAFVAKRLPPFKKTPPSQQQQQQQIMMAATRAAKQALTQRPAMELPLPMTLQSAARLPMHLHGLNQSEKIVNQPFGSSLAFPSRYGNLFRSGLGLGRAPTTSMLPVSRVLGQGLSNIAPMMPVSAPSSTDYYRSSAYQSLPYASAGGQLGGRLSASTTQHQQRSSIVLEGRLDLELAYAEARAAQRQRITNAMLSSTTFPNNGATSSHLGSMFGFP